MASCVRDKKVDSVMICIAIRTAIFAIIMINISISAYYFI